jgi:hypothetical protein
LFKVISDGETVPLAYDPYIIDDEKGLRFDSKEIVALVSE